ncbi:MAG: glycosyltransferase family 9 protein, partial [Thermodesulfobacteriota bacterium]
MNPCIHNILLIQLGDIGDVVLTTPTIRAVREQYPEARVSIMVRKPFGGLLAADPNLFEVVETEKFRGAPFHGLREHARFAQRLRKARYDLVIDLRTGTRGAIMTFLTGAPMRVGRHCVKPFWHDRLFTELVRNSANAPPPTHPGADQSLRIVRAIGIATTDSTPRLYLSGRDTTRAGEIISRCTVPSGARMITINPFSRWKYKEWPGRKWGQVIDRLWEGHRAFSLLVGSQEEAAAAAEIARGREGRTCNLAGTTTLGELAAVIAKSTLHLGVDSAASHIAAAVGTPTVTVHGPTDWRAWRVCDDMHRVVSPDMDCVPCHQKGCDG